MMSAKVIISQPKSGTKVCQYKKGLTRKKILESNKPPKGDFRAFTYDPKTGRGTWI